MVLKKAAKLPPTGTRRRKPTKRETAGTTHAEGSTPTAKPTNAGHATDPPGPQQEANRGPTTRRGRKETEPPTNQPNAQGPPRTRTRRAKQPREDTEGKSKPKHHSTPPGQSGRNRETERRKPAHTPHTHGTGAVKEGTLWGEGLDSPGIMDVCVCVCSIPSVS